MRVSKKQLAENRAALLAAGSRLFRERGIDGVGVAEIAKVAGLTHGALYAHFPSKDALVAEAFRTGFAGNVAALRAWAGNREPSLGDYLDILLSPRIRDDLTAGCPMTASASEIGRQGVAASESFAEALKEMAEILADTMDKAQPIEERRKRSLALVAGQIGAIAVSRAVGKADAALSGDVLASARALLAGE